MGKRYKRRADRPICWAGLGYEEYSNIFDDAFRDAFDRKARYYITNARDYGLFYSEGMQFYLFGWNEFQTPSHGLVVRSAMVYMSARIGSAGNIGVSVHFLMARDKDTMLPAIVVTDMGRNVYSVSFHAMRRYVERAHGLEYQCLDNKGKDRACMMIARSLVNCVTHIDRTSVYGESGRKYKACVISREGMFIGYVNGDDDMMFHLDTYYTAGMVLKRKEFRDVFKEASARVLDLFRMANRDDLAGLTAASVRDMSTVKAREGDSPLSTRQISAARERNKTRRVANMRGGRRGA